MNALEEVKDLAQAVARRRSLRLWDVEMSGRPGQSVLRVFVDSEDGVDLDTVAEVSEELSRGLDLRDPIPGRYTLEVSTPGLERTLKSPDHFKLSVGRAVVVKTTAPVVGNTNRIEGDIAAADEKTVTLSIGGTESGNGTSGSKRSSNEASESAKAAEQVTVPYQDIKTARTIFEWKRG